MEQGWYVVPEQRYKVLYSHDLKRQTKHAAYSGNEIISNCA